MARFNANRTLSKGGDVARTRYGGFSVSVEGLRELGAHLDRLGRDGIRKAIRNSMRGPGGEALAAEMRLRAPRDTGELIAGIGVHHDGGRGDVLVGYLQRGALPLGAWAESGVKPHMIQPIQRYEYRGARRKTKVTRSMDVAARKNGRSLGGVTALHFDGVFAANAAHPGYRGKKVASRSMKAAEWEVLADVVDQINYLIDGSAR